MVRIYGYEEQRTISTEALRTLCCRMNWFASGTNVEYGQLMEYCNKPNITVDDLVEMATLIMEHTARYSQMCASEDFNFNVDEDICTFIMGLLSGACRYVYKKEVM